MNNKNEIELDVDGKILKKRINEAIKLKDSLNEIFPKSQFINFNAWLFHAHNFQHLITDSEYALLLWYESLGK